MLVLLDNMNEVDRLNKAIADSAGSAEAKFENAYGKSTEAKMNVLKNSTQKLYMTMFDSNLINSAVGGLTSFVNGLNAILSSSIKTKVAIIGLTIAVIALSVAIKKVGVDSVNTALINLLPNIMKFLTSGKILTTVVTGLGTAMKFLLSPVGLISIAIGVATIAIGSHIKKQKELKELTDANTESYKKLTTALKENNVDEIKSGSSDLGNQQKELENLIKQRDELSKKKQGLDFEYDKSEYRNVTNQLTNVNKKIEEQKKVLKDSGVAFDEVTGKVNILDQAEEQLKQNALKDKIIQERDAIVKQKEDLIGLIQEYQNLAGVENKNVTQKERMTQLSNQLNGEIKGLVLARDEEGNTIIKNAGLLDTQISMLTTEAETAKTNANVKLTNAKNSATAQIGETKVTYEEISKRIKMYQAEMEALQALQTTASETLKASSSEDNWQLNASRVATINRMLTTSKSANEELQKAKDLIDKIYDGGSNAPSPSTSSNSSYIPPIKDSSSTKDSTTYSSDIKSEQTYSSIIDMQNDKLKIQDNLLDSISAKISEKEKLEETAEVIKYQNQLLTEQKNKLDLLSDSKSKYTSTLDTIKQDFYKRFSVDISVLSQSELNDIYDKMFTGERDFGVGEVAEKLKKEFEDNAGIFKSWSDDWYKIKDAIVDTDKAVVDLNSSMTDTQKSIKDIAKDGLNDYLEAMKKIDELTLKQKQANERLKLETDTYEGQTKDAWEKANQKKIDGVEKEIEDLNVANELEDERAERLEKQNNLIKMQNELSNIKNNKNVRMLEKGSDGTWNYQYTYDQEAYNKQYEELKQARKDYNEWLDDIADKHEIARLNALKKTYEEDAKTKDEAYSEALKALEKAQENETNTMELHYSNMEDLVDIHLEEIYKKYDGKWTDIVNLITSKVTEAETKYAELAEIQAKTGEIKISENPVAPIIKADNVDINVNTNGSGDSQLDYIKAHYPNMVDDYLRATGKKYATGGLNDSTGWHWLDGTPSKPELVLNSNDTQNLLNAVKLNSKFTSIIPNLLEKFKMPDFSKFVPINSNQSSEIHYHCDNIVIPNITNESGVANFFEGFSLQMRQKAVLVK